MSYEHTSQEPGASAACPIDLTDDDSTPHPLAEEGFRQHMPVDLSSPREPAEAEPAQGSKPSIMTGEGNPLPPFHADQNALENVGTSLAALECHTCGEPFNRSPEDFVAETYGTLNKKGMCLPA